MYFSLRVLAARRSAVATRRRVEPTAVAVEGVALRGERGAMRIQDVPDLRRQRVRDLGTSAAGAHPGDRCETSDQGPGEIHAGVGEA